MGILDDLDEGAEKMLKGLANEGGKAATGMAIAGGATAATGVGALATPFLEMGALMTGGLSKIAKMGLHAGGVNEGASGKFDYKSEGSHGPPAKQPPYKPPQFANKNIVQSQSRARRLMSGHRNHGHKFR